MAHTLYMDRVKRIWYVSPMRAAKVQASLRIRAVSPEPSLLAHKSSESRGTFRQKARSLAPLNGWACAVEICNDGMLDDTNSLDAPHMSLDMSEVCHIRTTRCRSAQHPHSLISTFVVHCIDSINISSFYVGNFMTLPSLAEQAGLSLTWS